MRGQRGDIGWVPRASKGLMVVMVAAAATGCGDDPQRESLVDEPVTEIADDVRSTTTDGDSTEQEPQRYRPGDCIDWEAATFDLKVVDCSSPHRMQVTEEVDGPEVTAYPSDDEWGSYSDEMCGPAAERFLGIEIDPHGRFLTMSIHPRRMSGHLAIAPSCAASSSGPTAGRTAGRPRTFALSSRPSPSTPAPVPSTGRPISAWWTTSWAATSRTIWR